MVAAEHDLLDIVHYLVDQGASIEAVDEVCCLICTVEFFILSVLL
jgi:hypothetical protein